MYQSSFCSATCRFDHPRVWDEIADAKKLADGLVAMTVAGKYTHVEITCNREIVTVGVIDNSRITWST